jgi:hypothetical protein
MKALSLEIKPLKGFGELQFGMTSKEVISFLGTPDDEELIAGEDDEEDILIYHYDEQDISAFFEGEEEKLLVNVETGNPEAELFGRKIFDMTEAEIVAMMAEKGYTDIDTETLEDEDSEREKRVSFDDAMTDLFFEEEGLTAISWGNFFFDDEE